MIFNHHTLCDRCNLDITESNPVMLTLSTFPNTRFYLCKHCYQLLDSLMSRQTDKLIDQLNSQK